jgi:COX assembly mitochondrial protein 1
MNGCMKAHATQAEQDAARERERHARKKAGQEDFLREWWGLPEADAERRRLEEEKLRRGERVGGFASRERVKFDEGEGGKAQSQAQERREGGGKR